MLIFVCEDGDEMKKIFICISIMVFLIYGTFCTVYSFRIGDLIFPYVSNSPYFESLFNGYFPLFIGLVLGAIISIITIILFILFIIKKTNFFNFTKYTYEEYKEARQKKKAEKEARKKAEKKADLEKQLQEIEKEL